MDFLWLFFICALNFGISWWNAKVVGLMWTDRPVMGLFMKAVLYSAAIMSAIGFSSVFMVGLAFLSRAVLEAPEHALLMRYMMSLWYVVVIIPVLATGLVITLHSWMEFLRERSWTNLAVSSWNTFAQIKNTYDAVQNLGPALDAVGDMFSSLLSGSGDSDGKAAIARLALAMVLLALVGGTLLTVVIIKANIGKNPLPSGTAFNDAELKARGQNRRRQAY